MRPISLVVLLMTTGVVIGQVPDGQPHGTVAEVMAGIVDPATNIVGTAAFIDPESSADAGGFAETGGWAAVERAAVTMAESANLLRIDGRLCANGRPAPVAQADWVEWTEAMRDAGVSAYAAATARNQEILLDLSESLTASCIACHGRYLDATGDAAGNCQP